MSEQNIKRIYEKHRTTKSTDFMTPLLVILFVFSVFSQLYTSVQSKLAHSDMAEHQCNPKYIFFSGFLNPLEKNPWTTTLTNFQKCVATNMYRDPKLTKEINKNKYYIRKNEETMKKTIDTERELVREINEKWDGSLESKQDDLNLVSKEKDKIFSEQGFLYNEVAKKSTQLFKVLQAILIYVQGILIYKVSDYKEKMDFDKVHEDFMTRYALNYEGYKQAYTYLDEERWTESINTARDTIRMYEAMTKEVEDYMNKNLFMVDSITESCYQLRYNMDNDACSSKIFPNINTDVIAMYPTLKKIFH